MGFSISVLLFLILLISLDRLAAQEESGCTKEAELCWKCSGIGDYSDGSIYESNLKNLLSSFSNSTENQIGFYNSSLGQDPNTVNAIALCRGDLAPDACRNCINDSSDILLRNCSNEKEALLWAVRCMVRYSPNLIFGTMKEDPVQPLPSPNPASNAQQFKSVLNPLLRNLSDRAASGDSDKKFAAGHATSPGLGGETIYALVQCTPDIDKQNCSDCLNNSISLIPEFNDGNSGGRVLKPSCTLRYENGSFYDSSVDSLVNVSVPVTPATPDALVPPKPGKKIDTTKIIIIVIAVVIAFVGMLITGVCIFLRAKQPRLKLENDNSEEISLVESLQYDFETVRSATDDFSDANKLGEGGFGAVYKGRLLSGQHIAVKRLSKSSEQGDREFKNEVMLLAQLQHRNLVRLLGFCLKEDERLLIYEYIPNTSLNYFIFDPINYGHLDWETRYKIISGIARGLLYLHEDSRLRIIHRDLKPSNILLGDDMNPKIADFGMARLFIMDQTQGDTKTIVGTYGYMAPEYVIHGRFSVKSDVFSFGVMVLEIVCGKKISSFRNGENEEDLLSYAWRNWREDTIHNIIDPMLTTGSRTEMMRCIHIGLLCVQENANDRPTMASVGSMLNSQSLTLSVPSPPAYFFQYNTRSESSQGSALGLTESSQGSSKSFIYVSQNEISNITEPYPR